MRLSFAAAKNRRFNPRWSSVFSRKMPVTIEIKCQGDTLKQKRRLAAESVIAYFGELPDRRLLCVFDDEDCQAFKALGGEEQRGFYTRIRRGDPYWGHRPLYVNELILVPDPITYHLKQTFDDLIYVHGSTCADETGLVMTFAHELQHFVQHGTKTQIWAENTLISNLGTILSALQLQWSDIPVEREARVVAKRTAEILCGAEAVRQYIVRKLAGATTSQDIADWSFIQNLDAANDATDLGNATRSIFQRLKSYRSELEKVLADFKNDTDFKDIDLAALTT